MEIRSRNDTMRESNQAGISVKGAINVSGIDNAKHKDSTALYKNANAEGVHNMYPGQLAFTVRTNSKKNRDDPRPLIQTSLNGLGTEAVELFPDNPLLQTQYLESTIDPVGMLTSQVDYNQDKDTKTGVNMISGGVRMGFSYVDVPFGVPVQFV